MGVPGTFVAFKENRVGIGNSVGDVGLSGTSSLLLPVSVRVPPPSRFIFRLNCGSRFHSKLIGDSSTILLGRCVLLVFLALVNGDDRLPVTTLWVDDKNGNGDRCQDERDASGFIPFLVVVIIGDGLGLTKVTSASMIGVL